MPITISQLQKQTRQITCYIDGEEQTADNEINFFYRPNAFTPELSDKFQKASEDEATSEAMLSSICDLVVSWDVMDKPQSEGGKPIPFDKANLEPLKSVPYIIITSVMAAIREDQKPKNTQAAGSLIG